MVSLARRQLKSRQTAWAKLLRRWLVKIGLSPNQISVASVIFAAGAGFSFLEAYYAFGLNKALFYILAAGCIQLRLLCNLLDGMMAIEGGLKSKSGDIFNEIPDRIADIIILVCVGFSVSQTKFSYAHNLGWLAALVAVMTAYVRLLGGALGTGQYFLGPMAKQHRMATLTVTCILSALAVSRGLEDYFLFLGLAVIIIGGIITLIRRVSKIIKELKLK